MTIVRIQPQAAAEAEEAAFWYEQRRPSLGMEFILELDAAIEGVADFPTTYAAPTASILALAVQT